MSILKQIPIAVFFVLFSFQAFSQIPVDKDLNKAIDGVTKLLGKTSNTTLKKIAPYLSVASMLLFELEDNTPSYAEMKAEWEGYTNQRISQKGLEDRQRMLEDYMSLLKTIQVDITLQQEQEIQFKVNMYEQILKGWDNLYLKVEGTKRAFMSSSVEPAAPLLPMLGAVIQLGMSALDHLVYMTRYEGSDAQKLSRYESYVRKREIAMKEWNQLLDQEIQKAADERVSKIVLQKDYDNYYKEKLVPCNEHEHNCLRGLKSVRKRYYSYRYWIMDGNIQISETAFHIKNHSVDIDNNSTQKSKQRELNNYKNQVRSKFVTKQKRHFELRDFMVIKVDLLGKQAKFKDLKMAVESFGPTKRMYITVETPPEEGDGYYMDHSGALDWQTKLDCWGIAYIEMHTPWARQVIRAFNQVKDLSPLKPLYNKDEKNPLLLFQEDIAYDPWTQTFYY